MAWRWRGPEAWDNIGAWKRGNRLGRGGFGSVYIGIRNSDKKRFAVKSVYLVPQSSSPDPDKAEFELLDEQCSLSSLINEIRTLKKLRSPYIIRYIGCGTSKGPEEMNHRLVLDCYLEFLPRGSLYNIINHSPRKRLRESFIKAYTKDILRGLVYLHFNKLVHGDLKCVNILMGTNNCKIADFGSVKDVRTSFFNKILFGTNYYQAPEVESKSEQTYASDIFSLGCTVLEMCTGELPIPKDKRYQVEADKFANREIPAHLTPECKDFLSKCFSADPRSRWTASDLLHHSFITKPNAYASNPYHMPLDAQTESEILQLYPQLIVPPNDLDANLPYAPFSPIHVVPMKRRRTGACCQDLNEADVAVPNFVPVEVPPAAVLSAYGDPVSDKHSALGVQPGDVSYPPSYEPELYPRDPNGNYVIPTAEERQNRAEKARSALAAIRKLNPEQQLAAGIPPQQSEVGSSVYKGYRVDFPAVAQLNGNDEDRSPLVVKICSEFGIPLPKEYQKWVSDPDYGPDAASLHQRVEGPFKRFFRAVFGFLK